MFNKVKINEEQTNAKYGYPNNNYGKRDIVIVECLNCHRLIERAYYNAFRLHNCPIVEGNNKKCFKCGQWKDLTLFHKSCKLSGGVAKICKECYNSYDCVKKYEAKRSKSRQSLFSDNIEDYIKLRTYQLKNNCKRNGVVMSLTSEDLYNLWLKQDGKCYYTGVPLVSRGKINGFQAWDSPSLDKKTPDLGYVVDNVVWCSFGINSCKQSFTEEEFKSKIQSLKWWFNNT